MRYFRIFTGGNTTRPVHHHKPRKTGRLVALTTTRTGDRIVFFRDNRTMSGGVA